MAVNVTLNPPPPHLIILEDAMNWLNDAIEAVASGDTAQAVYSTHTAIGFAISARDTLIGWLVPMPDET